MPPKTGQSIELELRGPTGVGPHPAQSAEWVLLEVIKPLRQ